MGSAYTAPPAADEQAGPFDAVVNSSGVCTVSVTFATDGGTNYRVETTFGRIAVFAFCTRSATPGSITPTANNFTEIDPTLWFPGFTDRASRTLILKRNIDEALLSPEFFGPTDYADGDTVPVPTSPVDGYVYSRSELIYVWTWKDVINNNGDGPHIRLPLFYGIIDQSDGAVALRCWRLPPGGPYVDDANSHARLRVIVMASRQASHPPLVDTGNTTPPSSLSSTVITGAASAELAIPSTTAGDFSLAHGLPVTPSEAWIQITSNGLIRFQPSRYDGTNVYLNASDDGLTGYVVFIYRANA